MTDILLGTDNDLMLEGGQITLIGTQEVLVRQRILNKLRAFTGTLFTNINYGISTNLVFSLGTKSLLDQEIKNLVINTKGVNRLVSYSSEVSNQRVHTAAFSYEISTGEIVGIAGLYIGPDTGSQTPKEGVWSDGVWDYSGYWANEEVWGI
jgi:hypothetical protein